MNELIFGIDFEVIGDGLLANDGTIAIYGINEQEQSIVLSNTKIEDCTDFFEKYNITSLFISRIGFEGAIDLSTVKFSERLRKLHLQLCSSTMIVFSDLTNGFENLKELTISGATPEKFLNLKSLTNLSALTLEYGNGLKADWIDLTNIRDLNIHDFKESDLSVFNGLINLRRLRLTNGKMKSLDGLESLPQLETLFIAANASKLTDVNAIIRSKNLKNIMFESLRKIQQWDFLKSKNDLQCICLDTAESVDFMKDFPNLEFFFCKKVLDKKSKSFLFSTTLHQDTMTKDGIQVSYIVPCNKFYDALD
jgi:hypothetical protein